MTLKTDKKQKKSIKTNPFGWFGKVGNMDRTIGIEEVIQIVESLEGRQKGTTLLVTLMRYATTNWSRLSETAHGYLNGVIEYLSKDSWECV